MYWYYIGSECNSFYKSDQYWMGSYLLDWYTSKGNVIFAVYFIVGGTLPVVNYQQEKQLMNATFLIYFLLLLHKSHRIAGTYVRTSACFYSTKKIICIKIFEETRT